MSKVFKISGAIASILLLLVGGVSWWAHVQRNQVLQWILVEINQNLNGQISAKSLDFTPFARGSGIGFTLREVAIYDSAYAQHRTKLLAVRRINVGIGVQNLLKGQFELKSVGIEEGTIRLFKQKNGYNNTHFFENGNSNRLPDGKNGFAARFFGGLQSVCFKDVAFQLDDSVAHKKIAFTLQDITNDLSHTPALWHTHWRGSVYFEELTFNAERGTFLRQKNTQTDLHIRYDPLQQYLYLDSSRLQVAQDWLGLQGAFGFLGKGVLKLNIQTDTLAVARALTLLPQPLANTITEFGVLPVVKANIQLDGLLNESGTPRIDIDFQTDTFRYETPVGTLMRIKAVANYTNHLDPRLGTTDQNSRISVTRLSGLLAGAVPYRAVFTVSNLENPQLAMNGVIETDLVRCNNLLDDRCRFGSGKATVSYRYRGQMFPLFDPKRNVLNGTLRGEVTLDKGTFWYTPQRLHLTNATGKIEFDENRLRVSFLHLNHQHNLVKMSGKIVGLLPYIFQSNGKVTADWAISTPDLSLDWIQNSKETNPKRRKKRSISALIDNVLARLNCKLTVVAKRVRFRRFRATDVLAKLQLSSSTIELKNGKMNAFGGSFGLSGGVNNLHLPTRQLYASGTIGRAEVKKVFQGFENFSQKTITDHHLSGTLSSAFEFRANTKKDFSIWPNSMTAKVNVVLEKGELTHFEPIKQVQRFLFKRRNFDQIRFATIQNEFNLTGKMLNISKMAVESSVLTMFVEGVYSFENKTDLLVQIPLSNFKRRSADYELVKHDLRNLKGSNIFLRAIEIDGSMKIKYDLFKRGRR